MLLISLLSASPREQQSLRALRPYAGLIGLWKGTATPEDRQSRRQRRFWRETSKFEFKIGKDVASITWTITNGELLTGGSLALDPESTKEDERLVLNARFADKSTANFRGRREGQWLVLNEVVSAQQPARQIKLRVVSDHRFVYSIAKQSTASSAFAPIVDVGNTREGVSLANSTGPECVVTGGKGALTVTYKGKSYYVCCEGCRQAFEEEPERFVSKQQ